MFSRMGAEKQLNYFKSFNFSFFFFIKYLTAHAVYLSIYGTYSGNLILFFFRIKQFLECIMSLHRGLFYFHLITVLSGVASTCLEKCTLTEKE